MGRVKKRNAVEPEPYVNENVHFIELYYNGEYIKAGTLMKLKNDRAVYVYESMTCNVKTGLESVNFRGQANGNWVSVRPNKIAGLFLKKSRAKKNV